MDNAARKQLRRFLLWGFGISLLAHLILGPFLGRIHYSEAEKSEPTIVSVTKKPMRIATPRPTATPTPPPKPTPTPPPPTPKPTPPPTPPPPAPKQTQPPHKAAPAPAHLNLNVPKTTSTTQQQPAENPYVAKPGNENGAPAGHGAAGAGAGQAAGPPGTPAPPACAQPHVDPSTKNPVQPEYPEVAREQGAFGTAKVAVTLDAHGTVVSAVIAQSAGNAALDQEAIKAAKASTYSPEIVDCKPIGGVYLFRAVFDSQ
jgi:periplasmic protein TonB